MNLDNVIMTIMIVLLAIEAVLVVVLVGILVRLVVETVAINRHNRTVLLVGDLCRLSHTPTKETPP